MKIKIGVISICAVLVIGCGTKKFDCPYNDGVYCKSLSEVNEMVNRGEHGKNLKTSAKAKENFFNKGPLTSSQVLIPIDTKEPIRVPEQVVRIWLAPYESQDGTFHQQTVINTVARPAHWVGAS